MGVGAVQPSFAQGYAPRDGPPAYPELHQGLVGCWVPSLGKQGKYLADVSGNHNTGVLTNFASTNAAYVPGDPRSGGYALEFDTGLSQHVLIDTAVISVLQMATISLWFRVTNVTSDHVIFSIQRATGFERGWQIIAGGARAGDPIVVRSYTGFPVELESNASYVADTWMHVVAQFGKDVDETRVKIIYINGKFDITEASVNSGVEFATATLIGAGIAGGIIVNPIDGLVANVVVWGRLLSSNEIQLLYERPNALLELAPRVYPAAVAVVGNRRRRMILFGAGV